MIYFTSDLHLFHFNIIKYCKRPFKTTEEMDYCIINNYNNLIYKNDIVFFLGDLTIKRGSRPKKIIKEIFKNLPGEKHLILGNHDYYTKTFYKECGFLSINRKIETKKYILVHNPADFNTNDIQSGKILIHGHIHSLRQKRKEMFDCGVDCSNFFPVSIDKIKKYF